MSMESTLSHASLGARPSPFKKLHGNGPIRVGALEAEPTVKAFQCVFDWVSRCRCWPPSLHVSLFITSQSQGVLLNVSEVQSSTIKVCHTPRSWLSLRCVPAWVVIFAAPLCRPLRHLSYYTRKRFLHSPSLPTHRLRAECWNDQKILPYVGCPTGYKEGGSHSHTYLMTYRSHSAFQCAALQFCERIHICLKVKSYASGQTLIRFFNSLNVQLWTLNQLKRSKSHANTNT